MQLICDYHCLLKLKKLCKMFTLYFSLKTKQNSVLAKKTEPKNGTKLKIRKAT